MVVVVMEGVCVEVRLHAHVRGTGTHTNPRSSTPPKSFSHLPHLLRLLSQGLDLRAQLCLRRRALAGGGLLLQAGDLRVE